MIAQNDALLPYTQISPMTRLHIERIVPASGEILVEVGQWVEAGQKIARIPVQGEIQLVDVARILGLNDPDLSRVMVKKRGDQVEAGEIIAARQGGLPFLHKPCRSPIRGRLLAIGRGMVVIQPELGHEPEMPADMHVLAFVSGQVVAIKDRRSVTIETTGAHIVGACGVGGEGVGVLQVLVRDPAHTLSPDDIGAGSNNAILVGGGGISLEAIDHASAMQVKGIIVGGISSSLHDLTPAPPFPIVATEGYGSLSMSPVVFDILMQLEGREASISGYMGHAWDDTRPAIFVPLAKHHHPQEEGEFPHEIVPTQPARVGHRVRAVRAPVLGQIAEIVAIPSQPQPLPSGLSLPGAELSFSHVEASPFGEDSLLSHYEDRAYLSHVQFVPWLNMERIG